MNHRSFGQVLRFVGVGLANTVIDFGLFNALSWLLGIRGGLGLLVINLFAVTAAMLFSYWANGKFTFGAQERPRAFTRFLLITVTAMLVNSLILVLVSQNLPGVTLVVLNLAKLGAAVASGTINFFGYRLYVYRERQNVPPEPGEIRTLSVVIPAYNEEKRLSATLKDLRVALEKAPYMSEVLIVDDGSRDGTRELVRSLQSEWPALRLISLRRNYGKGRAVRVGLGAARGDAVFYTDADHSVDLDQLPDLLRCLEEGAHFAIGVRPDPEGQTGDTGRLRRMAGSFYRWVVGLIVLPGYPDPQCGFKAVWRKHVPLLLERGTADGFALDVEFLLKAERAGLKVAQVPVRWEPKEGSSVRPLAHAPKTLLELLSIRTGLKDMVFPLAALVALIDIPIRMSHLWSVPKVGDEWSEVLLAYRIYQGKVFPLHNAAHDIGALYNYLLAGLFHLFGPSLYLPRLTVMAVSLVTVFITFLLGRALFGRWVGLFASALLATCGVDILVTHMAWSNDITPFFVTLGALFLTLALKRGRWYFPLAGLTWAFALQTHSSVLALLPAVFLLVWGLGKTRERLKDRWVWAGVGSFLLGYANMIYWNVIHPLDSFHWIFQHKKYAVATGLTPGLYLVHAWILLQEVVRGLASAALVGRGFIYSFPPPIFVLFAILFGVGLLLLLKEKKWVPLLLLVSPLLLYPYFTKSYYFIADARYIDDITPLALVTVAYAAAEIWRWISTRLSRRTFRIAWMAPLLAAAMSFQSIPALSAYYAWQTALGHTNQPLFALANILKADNPKGVVIVDSKSAFAQFLPQALAVDGIRVDLIGDPWSHRGHGSFSLAAWKDGLSDYPGAYVVLAPGDYRKLISARDLKDPDPHRIPDYIVIQSKTKNE